MSWLLSIAQASTSKLEASKQCNNALQQQARVPVRGKSSFSHVCSTRPSPFLIGASRSRRSKVVATVGLNSDRLYLGMNKAAGSDNEMSFALLGLWVAPLCEAVVVDPPVWKPTALAEVACTQGQVLDHSRFERTPGTGSTGALPRAAPTRTLPQRGYSASAEGNADRRQSGPNEDDCFGAMCRLQTRSKSHLVLAMSI